MENIDPRRVTVRGVIYKNGLLFCQELKGRDGQARGFWCTPGGGLELGESIIDGVKREIIEETGVAPIVGKLLFIQQFEERSDEGHGESEQLEFFFHIENPDDFETIDITNTTHGELEISQCSFIDPATSHLLPKFLSTIDIASYIETQQPVFVFSELG